MDNPIGHIVLETKRLLLRPNTKATWITTYQIETYSTPYICILNLQHQQSISTVMQAHARIRIRCERVQCEHMRCERMRCECAHSHRIACERISHVSYEHSHTLFGRLPRPICVHMRAFACDASVSGTVSGKRPIADVPSSQQQHPPEGAAA